METRTFQEDGANWPDANERTGEALEVIGLTAAEKARVRRALRAKLAELDRSAGLDRLSSIVEEGDEMERLQLAAQRALTAASLDQETKLYRAIRLALQRLDDGGYGRCIRCDEILPARRLAAIPWALMCAECQTEAEEEEKASAKGLSRSNGSDGEEPRAQDAPAAAAIPRKRGTRATG